ncbi:E3 ubiquitin-protein ligase ATL42 [Gossypium raimondii]|nr:E3 ubiquitin-protein ligase ATL42 [Gossypium raimondii]
MHRYCLMNQLTVLISLVLSISIVLVDAQSPDPSDDPVSNFRPSLAVVIGILCVMFALTFFLLIYAKLCHRGRPVHHGDDHHFGLLHRTRSQFSGIDRKVIESLPFFRFSSLKGSKQGLECAVCLSKFDDIEIMRLLPKCKHGFHVDCIDQWLEKHSSCPLCRQKVNAEDLTMLVYTNSMRFSRNQSELTEDSNIELYIEREQDPRPEPEIFHKLNHKIFVSDVVMKNRWSSVSSSDLMSLNAEMLNDMSSNRFSIPGTDDDNRRSTKPIGNDGIMKIKEEIEIKRLFENKVSSLNKSNDYEASTSRHTINQGDKRSMSEITALSRNRTGGGGYLSENYTKEERIRRLWLPIARRTVQWFVNKEKRRYQQQSKDAIIQHLNV